MMNLFNEDFLIEASDPENYEKAMSSFVLPFLESRAENASVCTVDGKNLHCLKYHSDVPVGTVLIVHGFTENTTKYSELVFSLLKNNFCVVIYDQRGHGRSWRDENISDTSVTHIDDFSQYVSDMNSVYECVLKKMPAPFFVFAHSMGGAVASLFLEEHPCYPLP